MLIKPKKKNKGRKGVYILIHKGCNQNMKQKELLIKNKKSGRPVVYVQTTTLLTFRQKEIGEMIKKQINNRKDTLWTVMKIFMVPQIQCSGWLCERNDNVIIH